MGFQEKGGPPVRGRRLLASMLVGLRAHADSDAAETLARWVANFLCGNSMGIYRCDDLESGLARAAVLRAGPGPAVDVTEAGCLHVVSEPFAYGGHTRVMKGLLACAPEQDRVLITRSPVHPDAGVWLGVTDDRLLSLSESEWGARIVALAKVMVRFKRLILYIHPDDVMCAAALHLARQVRPHMRVGFFNHADHSFSVGLGGSDCTLEISTYGWQLREARGMTGRAAFVGIPITGAMASPVQPDMDPSLLMTAGADYKFKPVEGAALQPVLSDLLARVPGVRLELVGPSAASPWWASLRENFGSRVVFHDALPYPAYRQKLASCALFVDSFPKTGGTAFPEALLAGTPVLAMKGGTWGFSLADVLRSASPQAFLVDAEALLMRHPHALLRQAEARDRCAAFHQPEAVWQRVSDAVEGLSMHPVPQELAGMGWPPLLAEIEWQHGRALKIQVPPRRSLHARAVHLALAQAASRAWGWWDGQALRLWAMWVARHAFR